MLTLYSYPKCSTCKKALAFLQTHNIAFSLKDITQTPPSFEELKAMLIQYEGNIRKLFNTSGIQYREMKLKDTLPTLSDEQALELLSKNGKLIKRPFLINEKTAIVGFKEDNWQTALL